MISLPKSLLNGLIFLGLNSSVGHIAMGQSDFDSKEFELSDLSGITVIDYEVELSPNACLPPSTAIPWDSMTALQKHLAFFDFNSDAKVKVAETYRGLRVLGLAPVLALPAALSINGAMATATAGYPTLTLRIASIEAGIHGSDTGIYDDDGVFNRQKFESWFRTWDKDHDDALSLKELAQRLYKEQDLFDFFGVMASGGEFGVLYLLAAEDGKISKERMTSLYEGTLFYDLAHERGLVACS